MERRDYYQKVYETLNYDDGPYLKNYDFQKFVVHQTREYLPLKVSHFEMNLHLLNRSFNFIRHRQSVSILSNIGRDSRLSPTGEEYSRRLAKYVEDVISKGKRSDSKGNVTKYDRPFRMWTFILRRTKETA